MQRNTRIRQFLVVAGAASLMLATSIAAGAAHAQERIQRRRHEAGPRMPTRAAPSRVATDATYAPDESKLINSSGTMIGFDVDLMYAVATTLGVKVNENSVTFDDIIASIKARECTSSVTHPSADTAAREEADQFC